MGGGMIALGLEQSGGLGGDGAYDGAAVYGGERAAAFGGKRGSA